MVGSKNHNSWGMTMSDQANGKDVAAQDVSGGISVASVSGIS
jgi:hypothetical protein